MVCAALPFCDRHVCIPRDKYLPSHNRGIPVSKEPTTTGGHLRRRRLQLKIWQPEAARLLGVSLVSLSRWECDKVFPTPPHHDQIAAYLGYDPFKTAANSAEKTQRQRNHIRCPFATPFPLETWQPIPASPSPAPPINLRGIAHAPHNPAPVDDEVAPATGHPPHRWQHGHLAVLLDLYSPGGAGVSDKAQVDHLAAAARTKKGGRPDAIFVSDLVDDVGAWGIRDPAGPQGPKERRLAAVSVQPSRKPDPERAFHDNAGFARSGQVSPLPA
jgi:transcriptional regulator with XRE-family HTH domain